MKIKVIFIPTVFFLITIGQPIAFSQDNRIPIKIKGKVDSQMIDTLVQSPMSVTKYDDSKTMIMLKDLNYLKSLSGNYTYTHQSSDTVTIKLEQDQTLLITIPGKGSYSMIPLIPTLFEIKELNGTMVSFMTDNKGVMHSLVLTFKKENKQVIATKNKR